MKNQRTITHIKAKEKIPEKRLNDQEIVSLQEKDFRLLMLKMMQTFEINWRQRWLIYREH